MEQSESELGSACEEYSTTSELLPDFSGYIAQAVLNDYTWAHMFNCLYYLLL